jgi:putative transposase
LTDASGVCLSSRGKGRHREELMDEHGVSVDHSTVNRRAIRFLLLIEKLSGKHRHQVGTSLRLDETYIKVKGL